MRKVERSIADDKTTDAIEHKQGPRTSGRKGAGEMGGSLPQEAASVIRDGYDISSDILVEIYRRIALVLRKSFDEPPSTM